MEHFAVFNTISLHYGQITIRNKKGKITG